MFRSRKNVFASGLIIVVTAAILAACQASQPTTSSSASPSTGSSGQSPADNQPANGFASPTQESSSAASNPTPAPADNTSTSGGASSATSSQKRSVALWNLDAETQPNQAFDLAPVTWVLADLGRSQQMHQAVADALGLSVDSLDKQLWEEGQPLSTILDEQGLTEEELRAAITDEQTAALQAAVKDGSMSQDEADWLIQHMPDANTVDLAVDPLGTSLMHQAVADALGLSVEELDKQLWQDGMTLWDIVDAQGMTREELQTALVEAHGKVVQQALADGLITPKQAEILAGQESGA
jgi:hypothetical protein